MITASKSHPMRFRAAVRLEEAKDLLHAVRGQDRAVQAQAESDLIDAIAIAEEWGILRSSGRNR